MLLHLQKLILEVQLKKEWRTTKRRQYIPIKVQSSRYYNPNGHSNVLRNEWGNGQRTDGSRKPMNENGFLTFLGIVPLEIRQFWIG